MNRRTMWFVVAGLAVALLLAFGVSRYASSQPDGLEKVAADKGLDEGEQDHALADSPFADYTTTGVEDPGLSTGLAGVIGVVGTFAVAGGVVWLVSLARRPLSRDNAVELVGGRHLSLESAYEPIGTPVHALPARVKIVCLVVFVLSVVATPPRAVWAFAVFAVLVLVVARLARLPIRTLVTRLVVEVPFILFAIALPFLGAGPRRELLGLSVSITGSWAAWSIVAKATIGVAASVVLAWSTQVAGLLAGLDRLHVPRALTVIAGFMLRYLDVVTGELHRLQIARVSRADDPRWLWQGRAVAATAGTLFVRSYERGERVHHAMLARGFDGRFPEVSPTGRERWWPAVVVPAVALVVAGLAWMVAG